MINNPFAIKPTRMFLQGDKELAAGYSGEVKRILFQLRNIQRTSPYTQELTKRYEDGTVINVHSKVKGMDVVNIIAGRGYGKEKKEEDQRIERYELPIPVIAYASDYDTQEIIGGYAVLESVGISGDLLKYDSSKNIFKSSSGSIVNGKYIIESLENVSVDFTGMSYEFIDTGPIQDPNDPIDYGYFLHSIYTIKAINKTFEEYDSIVVYGGSFDGSATRDYYGNPLHFYDAAKWSDSANGERFICIYAYTDGNAVSFDSGPINYWDYHFDAQGVASAIVHDMDRDDTFWIKVETDEDEFVIYENHQSASNDGGYLNEGYIKPSPEAIVLCGIFDYSGKPVYVYKLEYYPAEIYTDWDDPENYIHEYGIIYNREIRKIRFVGTGDNIYSGAHSFKSAVYVSPKGKEIDIKIPDKIEEMFGAVQIWVDDDEVKNKETLFAAICRIDKEYKQ